LYEIESQQEKRIVDAVNKTHPQLSPVVDFALSTTLGWKLGLILCATKSFGKSTVLNAVSNIVPYQVVKIDDATPAGLKALGLDELLSNNKTLLITDDLATICASGTNYLEEQFLVTTSQLIYAGGYRGGTSRRARINNAEIVALIASTPITLETVMRTRVWDANVSERFVRLYPMYYNRVPKVTEEAPSLPMNNHFPEELKWKVSDEKFKKVYLMLRRQFTPNRADLIARKLLTGHARLCRRIVVKDEDAEWLSLYEPFIAVERNFLKRDYVSSGGWIRTSPLLFNHVLNVVLFWISLCPQTLSSLVINTSYQTKLLKLVLKRFKEEKWVDEIKKGNKIYYTIGGKFREKLLNLYSAFNCKVLSPEEFIGE